MTAQESPRFTDHQIEEIVFDWRHVLNGTGITHLKKEAIERVETPGGVIYVIETPKGLVGDGAVVVMDGIDGDMPHYHEAIKEEEDLPDAPEGDLGELELHFAMAGYALMGVGLKTVEMIPGHNQIIRPGQVHFTTTKCEEPRRNGFYVCGVVSLPGYDKDREINIDLSNPPALFNADLYATGLPALG